MARTPFDFTEEFVNASEVLGIFQAASLRPPREQRAFARIITMLLQAQVDTLSARGGGYLYFPEGRYPLGRWVLRTARSGVDPEVYADLIVPPNVTLWFAPGAMLVPLDGEPSREGIALTPGADKVYVEIQGDIIAQAQQIFDVIAVTDGRQREAGIILLTGDRIREVYPEWWGASSGTSVGAFGELRNRLAIQAAFDAAYHNRTTPQRRANGTIIGAPASIVWRRRPSIPVVLKGSYFIDTADGELLIGASLTPGMPGVVNGPVPRAGFELRGEAGLEAQGCLQGSAPPGVSRPGHSLLVIRGPVSFSIRNVVFNANNTMGRCVTIEPVVGEWGYSSFDGCNFKDCLRELVHLDAGSHRVVSRVPTWNSVRDFWNLTFTRCRFTPQTEASMLGTSRAPGPLRDRRIENREGNLVGVHAELEDNEGLEFRDCFIAQAASPGIRALSGRFAINDCNFHVLPPPFHPDMQPLARIEALNDKNDSSHGTDIVITKPASRQGRVPGRIVPAAFTARECESHSLQFLATPERTEPWPDGSDERRSAVVLLNVASTHEQEDFFLTSRRIEPPGIFWGYPGRVGCVLVMIGCHQRGFRRVVPSSRELLSPMPPTPTEPATPGMLRVLLRERNHHMVYYEPPLMGDIYDVASDVREGTTQFGRTVFSITPGNSSPIHVRRLQRRTTIRGLRVSGG